jgi:hypothetical protein
LKKYELQTYKYAQSNNQKLFFNFDLAHIAKILAHAQQAAGKAE